MIDDHHKVLQRIKNAELLDTLSSNGSSRDPLEKQSYDPSLECKAKSIDIAFNRSDFVPAEATYGDFSQDHLNVNMLIYKKNECSIWVYRRHTGARSNGLYSKDQHAKLFFSNISEKSNPYAMWKFIDFLIRSSG